MRDYLFFDFVFSNYAEYLLYCFFFCLTLFALTKRTVGHFFDPFHFYYTFTFGTSYAVILILYAHGFVNNIYFSYLVISGLIFLLSFLLISKILYKNKAKGVFYRLNISICNQERLILKILVVLYFLCVIAYLSQVSLSSLIASRFEANKGIGFIVRIMDVLRLVLAAWFYLVFLNSGRKRYLIYVVAVSLIGAMLSGAKFAMLEQIFVIFTAAFILKRRSIKINIKTILISIILAVVMFIFIFFLIQRMSENIGYINSQYLPGMPVVFELFLIRILANADSYYLSLTENILDVINVKMPLLQFFSNVFGNGLMSRLFGMDFANNDIGRQIWLYWYPADSIMRGPTAHFDITGYVYLGYIGGILASAIVGVVLGTINSWKYRYYFAKPVTVAFVATVYCRSLPILLNPSVGIAYISDIFILLFILLCCITLCKGAKYDSRSRNRDI
ncbi:oligosaccharide repeat unit polymerase [Erwinia persicina]|uniref:Oligosaccharide repeat unit polymerase n=1 Tax=Erwinia persicina TaxID=55211 RepID=A0A4U3F7W8_9GAMM|nr:oligosaccharide repeat unit polymerase [Erwinia persicina]MBD8105571.1 oligosaccharide repeat unit polymerase [Erwinia persicina]MBD8209663.1 oligosaccharide repeat unit polymerase [Erwinia persicina]TKJ89344.1 hypothetical protein EpCFBP13511_13640 [Erwinia persicina]